MAFGGLSVTNLLHRFGAAGCVRPCRWLNWPVRGSEAVEPSCGAANGWALAFARWPHAMALMNGI